MAVSLGDGPVASGVIDLVTAKAVARAIGLWPERREETRGAVDRLERRQRREVGEKRERVTAVSALRVFEVDDLTARGASEQLHRRSFGAGS
jgi:hypothetical protein